MGNVVKSIGKTLGDWFFYNLMRFPTAVKAGMRLATWSIGKVPFAKTLIRKTIYGRFCGGESLEDCLPVMNELALQNIGVALDFGLEGSGEDAQMNRAKEELLHCIAFAHNNPQVPFVVFKVTALLPKKLLEKRQGGEILSEQESDVWLSGMARIEEVCRTASENEVRLFIDAEESWIQQEIRGIAMGMMERFNKEAVTVFSTYQMYRKQALSELDEDLRKADQADFTLGVKLVRGAYMETERRIALQAGEVSPIHETKMETDTAFNQGAMLCFRQGANLCLASHNQGSCVLFSDFLRENGIRSDDARFWFSQLFGMADELSASLVSQGFNVVKYLPYGPVEDLMPYLLRRVEENSGVFG